MGEQLVQRHQELHMAGATSIAAPVTLHTYHGDVTSPSEQGIPPGFAISHLRLSQDDCVEIQRASLLDHEEYLGIPLSTIFAVITQAPGHDKCPTTSKTKLAAWKGVRFFKVTPPDTTTPLMYTPASAQILAWGDDASEEVGYRTTWTRRRARRRRGRPNWRRWSLGRKGSKEARS